MAERSLFAAKIWYGLSMAAPTFLLPFINVYYRHIGLDAKQIGIISALRPWVSAPSGNILCALADRFSAHMLVLMGSYVVLTAIQTSILFVHKFPAQLAMAIAAAAVSTPPNIIADASVMAASTRPGAYGETRVWASIMWGVLSPVAGFVNTYLGLAPWGFMYYAVVSLIAIVPGLWLPTDVLSRKGLVAAALAEEAAAAEEELPPEIATAAETAAALPPPPEPVGVPGRGLMEPLRQPLLPPSVPPSVAAPSMAASAPAGFARAAPSVLPSHAPSAATFRDRAAHLRRRRAAARPPAAARDTFAVLAVPPPGQFYSGLPSMGTSLAASQQMGAYTASQLPRSMRATPISTSHRSQFRRGSVPQPGDVESVTESAQAPPHTPRGAAVARRYGADLPTGESVHEADALSLHSGGETASHAISHSMRERGAHPIPTARAADSAHEGSPSHSVFALAWSPSGFHSQLGSRATPRQRRGRRAAAPPPLQTPPRGMSRPTSTATLEWLAGAEHEDEEVEAEGGMPPQFEGFEDERYEHEEDAEEHRPLSEVGDALADQAALLGKEGVAAPGVSAPLQPSSFLGSLALLLSNPEIIIFFIVCTLQGFGHMIIGGYLFMYIEELGGAPILMGLVLAANSFSETPVFMFFGKIVALLGITNVLYLSLFTLAARMVMFMALEYTTVWIILPIETLHAITYAGGWSACAINSARVAPKGLEATTQGLFQSLWVGVGGGIGGLAGGYMYHRLGPALMFQISALGIAVIASACALGLWLLARRAARYVPEAGREGKGAVDGKDTEGVAERGAAHV